MIEQEIIQSILGINEKVSIKPENMARELVVTVLPFEKTSLSKEIVNFYEKLFSVFKKLGVTILPYEDSIITIPISKVIKTFIKAILNNVLYLFRYIFNLPQKSHYLSSRVIFYLLKRKKIRKGVSVFVLGEQETNNLQMQYIYSFKDNSIISILDFPKNISEESTFHEHFDTALNLFTYHMTNIVLGVTSEKWLLYNFNASHPIFDINSDFELNVSHALIPKIVAPIRPYKLSEFTILKSRFNPNDEKHKHQVNDLVNGALLFSKTSLYPEGKKIDSLPFRNEFYKWIGKLHLDNRNGMSYGFLAIQMPGKIYPLVPSKEFEINKKISYGQRIYSNGESLYVKFKINDLDYWLEIPEVWVISQKSGSDKTHVNPDKDILKLGLKNGKMYIQSSLNSVIDNDYKTSFDTQVILSHAVGNAIIASILHKINPESDFVNRYLKKGISISHWHGYIRPDLVPVGWFVHGITNPHVACSSPQSAIYALQGKIEVFLDSIKKNFDYMGDIHIEPHHGTNICFTSVSDLANYLINNPKASVLGNEYYYLYNNHK